MIFGSVLAEKLTSIISLWSPCVKLFRTACIPNIMLYSYSALLESVCLKQIYPSRVQGKHSVNTIYYCPKKGTSSLMFKNKKSQLYCKDYPRTQLHSLAFCNSIWFKYNAAFSLCSLWVQLFNTEILKESAQGAQMINFEGHLTGVATNHKSEIQQLE